MRRLWLRFALLLATAAAIDCPGGTSLVDLFELNGTQWAACEDLQVPGGALALVPSSGATEWFHKTHETYGSAPLGSDDAFGGALKARGAPSRPSARTSATMTFPCCSS